MRHRFLTPVQDIALNLAFEVVGERRNNRSVQEYASAAQKMLNLKELIYKVNELLDSRHCHAALSGVPLPQLCRFKAGDARWTFEDYPRQISIETLRLALEISGMRSPRFKRHKSL